jgi:hypothetical protein
MANMKDHDLRISDRIENHQRKAADWHPAHCRLVGCLSQFGKFREDADSLLYAVPPAG